MLNKALSLFHDPGSILEIRALNCWDRNPEYLCTRVGYFDDMTAASAAVDDLEKTWHPEGIYLTLNPVKPELLGRAANRMRKGKKDESTKNEDIARRRWILFDFDPKRPAGISSNEIELWHAGEQARLCACWLRDHAWPLPVIAMSGNGFHLLYRIELPTDDGDLIKRCLATATERFSTPSVQVDSRVFNAARITKLYGTLARKGDPTDDRPHRRSELVEVPDPIEVVDFTRLEWLAGPKKERSQSSEFVSDERMRVEHWLSRHGANILNRDKDSDGSDIWLIDCPNKSTHSTSNGERDCSIIQYPSGMVGGNCFHDSCGMKDWQALKAAIGPVEYEDFHEPIDASSVDLSGLIKTETDAVSFSEKLPPFPAECMSCGGLIERIVDYNLRTAIYPMPELALAGALALMSLITGRKVEDRWELRTNAYFLGLADAGSGKNHSRQVNNKILAALKKTDLIGPSKLKSSSGLISALEQHPASLFQIDEMSRLLQTMRDPRNAPHLYDIGTVMLEAYSESANPAWKAGAYADRKKNPCVEYPHLVLYGVAVSSEFWQSLTKSNLTDGLLGRLMPFESRERIGSRDPVKSPPDEPMLAEVASWLDFSIQKELCRANNPPECQRLHHTAEAWARYQEHFKAIEKSRPGESDTAYSIWKRTGEKTGKLAMLSACSRVPPISGAWPVVELRDVDWAIKLSNWLTRTVLIKAGLYVSESPHEQNLIRLLRELENWKSRAQLCRDMRWLKARDRDELLRNAIADGYVVEKKTDNENTRPTIEYRRTGRISL